MSYLVLARKSRPQTFEQVVGQRSVVKTLQNSIRRNRVAHAILFSGVRGVGKTTLARIMAKALNCEGEGDAPPCGHCAPCKEITSGNALDLFEIDGASNRGIQEIRELKEKIMFLPASCRYKIVIIDEVHMLTVEAFNALLKTLEEPPEHVYFMFATTELHKIPMTILSRCQQYALTRIPAQELADHFNRLANEENITIDPAALSLIVREAEGSVRDGLSLLDQVFSFGENHITVADVTELLGLLDRDLLLQLATALLQGDRTAMLHALDTLCSGGLDYRRFADELLDCFRTMLMTQIKGCDDLVDRAAEDLARYRAAAQEFSVQTLHMRLGQIMDMVEHLRHATQPRLTLETGLLKVIETNNVVPVSALVAKIHGLMDRVQANGAPVLEQEKKDVPVKSSQREDLPELPVKTAPPPVKTASLVQPVSPLSSDSLPSASAPSETPPLPVEPPEVKKEAMPAAQGLPRKVVQEKDLHKNWAEFLVYLKEHRVWMSQVLSQATRVEDVANEILLYFEDATEGALLRQRENLVELSRFFVDFFHKERRVRLVFADENDPDAASGAQNTRQRRNQLLNDPLTVMTTEIFGGRVGSVRLTSRKP